MKTGIELITEERHRQINKHGYDSMHDDSHSNEELVEAAIAYLLPDILVDTKSKYDYNDLDDKMIIEVEKNNIAYPIYWPFKPEEWHGENDDRITQLKKAGALIAAQIDNYLRQQK